MFTPEDLELLLKNMRERYNTIPSPNHCKCLNQKIVFNARGFHHLLYDGSGKARTMIEARARIVLIPLIVPVLKQAVNSSYEKRYARKNRKKNSPSILVEMWGMEAAVGKNKTRIRVVLRREGNGNIIFWSVMRIK